MKLNLRQRIFRLNQSNKITNKTRITNKWFQFHIECFVLSLFLALINTNIMFGLPHCIALILITWFSLWLFYLFILCLLFNCLLSYTDICLLSQSASLEICLSLLCFIHQQQQKNATQNKKQKKIKKNILPSFGFLHKLLFVQLE